VKILLVYPFCLEARLHAEDSAVVPMGLYYVGALLKHHGYDVEVLNWHDINREPARLTTALKEKQPDVIGFSILHANRWGGIEIARTAKRLNPKVKIIFGGIGATFLWRHFLTHFPEVDVVVLREGEYPFLDLVRSFEKDPGKRLDTINGIAFRKNGHPFKTPDTGFIQNLDELPDPAIWFDFQHVALTRGCPGNCTFCGSPRFWKRKVRFHSADYFVGQLERLCQRGIKFFYFSDDTFTIRKETVIQVCRKIITRGLEITWAAISRVNYVDEEMMRWMKRAGCIQISYGVESGSTKIRDFLNKNITEKQIETAFALTLKYGIMARAYFIYGCPGEDQTTIEASLAVIDKIKPLSAIFYILDIFPGTALYEQFLERTRGDDDIWLDKIEDIMYFETDPALTKEMILSFGETLRTTFYKRLPAFVDAIELTDDPSLSSSHADFFSRLGMTFDQGDYSDIAAIPGRQKVAKNLYKRALAYGPDARAFLGLGLIRQKKKDFSGSVEILSQGAAYFPTDEPISLCLGISLMNMGAFERALSILSPFQQSKQALFFMAECYRALNDTENQV
jgi:radical SAM superfamily enzyme YgiQ (UPF0313 family)